MHLVVVVVLVDVDVEVIEEEGAAEEDLEIGAVDVVVCKIGRAHV